MAEKDYVSLTYTKEGANDRFSVYRRLFSEGGLSAWIVNFAKMITTNLLGYNEKGEDDPSNLSTAYAFEQSFYNVFKTILRFVAEGKGQLRSYVYKIWVPKEITSRKERELETKRQTKIVMERFKSMNDYIEMFFISPDSAKSGNVWIKIPNESKIDRFERIQSGFEDLISSIFKSIVTGKLHKMTATGMRRRLERRREAARSPRRARIKALSVEEIQKEEEKISNAEVAERAALFEFDMKLFQTLRESFGNKIQGSHNMLRSVFNDVVLHTGLKYTKAFLVDVFKYIGGDLLSPMETIFQGLNIEFEYYQQKVSIWIKSNLKHFGTPIFMRRSESVQYQDVPTIRLQLGDTSLHTSALSGSYLIGDTGEAWEKLDNWDFRKEKRKILEYYRYESSDAIVLLDSEVESQVKRFVIYEMLINDLKKSNNIAVQKLAKNATDVLVGRYPLEGMVSEREAEEREQIKQLFQTEAEGGGNADKKHIFTTGLAQEKGLPYESIWQKYYDPDFIQESLANVLSQLLPFYIYKRGSKEEFDTMDKSVMNVLNSVLGDILSKQILSDRLNYPSFSIAFHLAVLEKFQMNYHLYGISVEGLIEERRFQVNIGDLSPIRAIHLAISDEVRASEKHLKKRELERMETYKSEPLE